ncbi:MAG: hypothetical protein C4527_23970 [Candidatus Omnitrophota bacterium]|jgi:hypothetical protein|nr:MAG: hypothetical protein C4527_23970 [Candidatus Omnitrophota bacterium]
MGKIIRFDREEVKKLPVSEQLFKLRLLADQFQRKFSIPGLAETSFITTAHLEGFQTEYVHEVAASFWPNGYAARRMKTVMYCAVE